MRRALWVLAIAVSACTADEPPPPPDKAPEGRAETQAIRNTQAVGTSGGAVADKVDEALKKNDENVKKAEEESAEQPDE